ncbi:SURF1 family cytochrome oxidase biogenesis protein [Pacificibacter sp. AS14]|uniref:SURF1 family protein n=1 Tax=Pacificibacter sp. AS14 TaxID=3135785 RepID=UPI003174549A
MSDTRRPIWVDVTILLLAGIMLVGMIVLGNWQVRRLAWKLDLIEAVETRAFGEPAAAPNGGAPEYLRIFTSGILIHDKSLRVKAVTEIGPGFWIMTPLETAGKTIWINRGFVPSTLNQDQWTRPEGQVEVIGLARLDQPGGTLLERNQPETGRWVSADLVEMSRAVGLDNVQTGYFIDAEATPAPPWPRGGLTRLAFQNTHLIYALTWYAMAALFLGAIIYVVRDRLSTRD